MAISTYAELKSAIVDWLDVDTAALLSQVDNLIIVAERRINRDVRCREMEKALTATITSGVVAVPSDYINMKFCYVNTSPIRSLERRSAEWINLNYPYQSGSGIPLYIARNASNFIFGPYPDSGYTVNGIYFCTLPAVSVSPNAMFLANPDMYLMCALAESETILQRDARVPMWQAKADKIIADINSEYKLEDQSGSTLQMRTAQSNQRPRNAFP
jgi:hypothetical protein